MKIATPISNGMIADHFGHCRSFRLYTVDPKNKTILSRTEIPAPPHTPGFLPHWLESLGVTHVIARGMGRRALDIFEMKGIRVYSSMDVQDPDQAVERLLEGTLQCGINPCDH